MEPQNPIVGGTILLIPAIQSPNFVAGISGWAILKTGEAFFNDVVITGGSLIISTTDEGVFIYNGTPASGNLTGSWTAAAGTDQYGNTYPEGLKIVDLSTGGTVELDPTFSDGVTPGLLFSGPVVDVNKAAVFLDEASGSNILVVQSPQSTGDTDFTSVAISMAGAFVGKPGSATGFLLWQQANSGGSLIAINTTAQWDSDGFHVFGDATAVHPGTSGGSFTAETWQNPVMNGPTWVSGPQSGNVLAIQYRAEPSIGVGWIYGACHVSVAVGAGSLIFTLPAAYAPTTGEDQRVGVTCNNGGTITEGYANISGQAATLGQVTISQAIGGGDVYFHSFYRMS